MQRHDTVIKEWIRRCRRWPQIQEAGNPVRLESNVDVTPCRVEATLALLGPWGDRLGGDQRSSDVLSFRQYSSAYRARCP